jgi:hypothetical protein
MQPEKIPFRNRGLRLSVQEAAMLLDLTEDEARELRIALDAQLHGLRVEYAATEARRFKARLRKTLDHLESISARLGSLDLQQHAAEAH